MARAMLWWESNDFVCICTPCIKVERCIKMISMILVTSPVWTLNFPPPQGHALPHNENLHNSPTSLRMFHFHRVQQGHQLLYFQHFLNFLGTNDLAVDCPRFQKLYESDGSKAIGLCQGWIQGNQKAPLQSGKHNLHDVHQRSKSKLSFLLKW